jgi:uncharacterized protein (DUF1697 family)
MENYFAFLRGINVGGHRIIPMAQLRQSLKELPLKNVQTYIQSGNIIFKANEQQENLLTATISKQINEDFSFEVPVLVKSGKDLLQVFNANPYVSRKDFDLKNCYFTLLQEACNQNIDIR